MNFVITRLRGLLRKDSGQDILEYSLLVALIALVAVAAVTATGTSVDGLFTTVSSTIDNAIP